MTIADIKARVKTTIEGVAGIGKVYARMRFLTAESDMKEFTGPDGRLHVWMVRRELTALTDQVVNENFTQQDDTLVIEGFYAVQDGADSENVFDALLDAVLQAVNADRRPPSKLAGLVAHADPPFVRKLEYASYGQTQVLCHHAEIAMKVNGRNLQ